MALQVDFGRTAGDYARFRAGFPPEFFNRLEAAGIGFTGNQVLDLGTGTGTLAREFARRGATVTGLDKSKSLLGKASLLAKEKGVTVKYVVGLAEDTKLGDSTFDVITAGQCWHWFNRPLAANEAHRLLKPGGMLILARFDWLPLPGNAVEATEQLIRSCNPDWDLGGGNCLRDEWLMDMTLGGFKEIESFSFDVETEYSHRAWRGRIRASAGVGASLSPDVVADFDSRLEKILELRFPEDPMLIPHRVFTVISKKAGG